MSGLKEKSMISNLRTNLSIKLYKPVFAIMALAMSGVAISSPEITSQNRQFPHFAEANPFFDRASEGHGIDSDDPLNISKLRIPTSSAGCKYAKAACVVTGGLAVIGCIADVMSAGTLTVACAAALAGESLTCAAVGVECPKRSDSKNPHPESYGALQGTDDSKYYTTEDLRCPSNSYIHQIAGGTSRWGVTGDPDSVRVYAITALRIDCTDGTGVSLGSVGDLIKTPSCGDTKLVSGVDVGWTKSFTTQLGIDCRTPTSAATSSPTTIIGNRTPALYTGSSTCEADHHAIGLKVTRHQGTGADKRKWVKAFQVICK
jgi:hypothetical protein